MLKNKTEIESENNSIFILKFSWKRSVSLKFQSWTDQKDQKILIQNYEMELRNKKIIPVWRNKATKGKKKLIKIKECRCKDQDCW